MKHYTYLIWNTVTRQKYIGVRTATLTPELDNLYYGSSKYLNEDIKKFGVDIFKKRILKSFKSRKDALDHEIYLHNKYDVAVNENFYNKAKQTNTGFDSTGVPSWNAGLTCPQISNAKKGKTAHNKNIPMNKEQKEKLSDNWKVEHPDGTIEYINNMGDFCQKHKLNPSAMSKVARGKARHHKEYKCRKLTEKRSTIKCDYNEWKSKGKPGKALFGGDNPFAKEITVNNVLYSSMKEASVATGLSMYKLRKLGKK